MSLYCWGWRVMSTGCPDCGEEYLRVSFDWAHLSLLMDGGSADCPRWRQFSDSVKIQSGRRPGVSHRAARALTNSCVHQARLQQCFTPNPAALRLGDGLAPVVWGLSLASGTDPFSSPHSPTPSP